MSDLPPNDIDFTVGSLFSGIGGLDLGLGRAGMTVKWQVEIDDYCNKVLEKHWPDVKRYRDVRTVGDGLEHVDLICGGFPCQPVSVAGQRKGKDDERWLWPGYIRIVRQVKPRWVLVENVPGLLSMDSGRLFAGILRDLSESGYDAEWDCIPAAAFGAPHLRYRVFIVAYTKGQQGRRIFQPEVPTHVGANGEAIAYTIDGRHRSIFQQELQPERSAQADVGSDGKIQSMADANGKGLSVFQGCTAHEGMDGDGVISPPSGDALCHSSGEGLPDWAGGTVGQPWPVTEFERPSGREIERDFRGVAYGVSARVQRLKGLGNAVVPPVAEWIGRRIIASERLTTKRY